MDPIRGPPTKLSFGFLGTIAKTVMPKEAHATDGIATESRAVGLRPDGIVDCQL
jgi:hypothetical protein